MDQLMEIMREYGGWCLMKTFWLIVTAAISAASFAYVWEKYSTEIQTVKGRMRIMAAITVGGLILGGIFTR